MLQMIIGSRSATRITRLAFSSTQPLLLLPQQQQQQQQLVRQFHIRHTHEINPFAKRGVLDASFELRKLLRDDKVFSSGKERRVKPSDERREQKERYIYQIEKRARKKIIKYIMSKIEARKKAKGQWEWNW